MMSERNYCCRDCEEYPCQNPLECADKLAELREQAEKIEIIRESENNE